MTQAEIQTLLQNIKKYADIAAGASSAFLPPQLLIPVAIGKAIIDLVPSLEGDVANMIAGTAPTPEQDAATADKLKVLGDPGGL